MRGNRYLFLLALLVMASAVFAQTSPRDEAGMDVAAASGQCIASWSSGAGATYFYWCLTTNGNVMQLKGPMIGGVSKTELDMDAYLVCDDTNSQYYFDTGYYSGGGTYGVGGTQDWGAATVIWPGTPPVVGKLPVKIIRTTTDGQYTLTQTISQNVTDKYVKMTMALKKNYVGYAYVWLWRIDDFYVDQNTQHYGAANRDAAVEYLLGGTSLALVTASPATEHKTGITPFGGGNLAAGACGTSFLTNSNITPGDYTSWLGHKFYFTGVGTRTAIIEIRRF